MKFKFHKEKEVSIKQHRWSDFHFDGNTFTTKMDPDSQALKYPTPYPLFTRRNTMLDVEYLGGPNDADSTVAMATLDRNGSQYKLFDAGNLPLQFAYLGLGMAAESHNNAYNKQFVNIMLESLSAAYATQMTELPFMTYDYTTTIPEMESGDSAKVGYLVWYQSVVQNVAGVMAKYNSNLAMHDYLVKMGYNGEAPQMTALTNLLKKQNTYSLLDQIGVIVSQEYFDLDWFKEVTVLNGLPSRVAADAQSPLLTITGSTYVPKVEVKSGDTVVFSTITAGSDGYDAFNNIKVTLYKDGQEVTTTYTFQSLVQHIMDKLDPVTMLAICRQVYAGTADQTVVYYVNDLNECLKALIQACATFKTYTIPVNTFLMLLQSQTALNRWVYGTPYVTPSRPRQQVEPQCVRVIHDVFKAFGTSGNLVWDDTTKKWKIYTLWKGGEGIAEYDSMNGGFAISASVREIPEDSGSDYLSPKYMFPRMFYRYSTTDGVRYQMFVNRLGFATTIQVNTLTAAQIAADAYFAYLNMVGASDLKMDVPTITLTSVTTDYVLMSAINKLMINVFGYATANFGSGSSMITNKAVNTDNIGFVGRQFGNFAEASVDYLTARAPLRQTDNEVNIGFKTTSVSPDRKTANWD